MTGLSGSCACGRVRYAVDGELGPIVHCHCETCRKVHAAAFSSLAAVRREAFRLTAGEELLSHFESSPGKFRHFCSACGSHLFAERTQSPHVMLRLGCLDTRIVGDHVGHIWREDAASWFDPKQTLKEFPQGYPPAAERGASS